MKTALLVLACAALTACGSPSSNRPGTSPRQQPEAVRPVSEVTMTCDGVTTRFDAPAVEVQRDGVHLTIVNTSGEDLGYSVSFPSGGGFGDNAPRSNAKLVLSLPPGEVKIGCPDPEFEGDPTEGLPTLSVLDPESLYIPKELECTSGSAIGSDVDYGSDVKGQKRDPVDLVKEQFASELDDGDQVVRAGYPDEVDDPTVAIRRDGRTVVSVHFFGNDHEGYLSDSENICGEFRP